MAILIAYYSWAGENYFGGAYRRIPVGNTEKAAQMLASLTGGELFKIEQALFRELSGMHCRGQGGLAEEGPPGGAAYAGKSGCL